MKGKYLITTYEWFVAPDGKSYKSVWGEVEILRDNILGVETNRGSSNWFAMVGNKNKHVIVAGCQIHYACRSEDKPNTDRVTEWQFTSKGYKEAIAPSKIYIAH